MNIKTNTKIKQDIESKLITLSRKEGETDFCDQVFIRGDYRVTLEYIDEGISGDYNPKDENDYPHLRFSCDHRAEEVFDDSTEWEGLENASYCTQLPTTTPVWMLKLAADKIFKAIDSKDRKRKLEQLSWLSITDFKGIKPASSKPQKKIKIKCLLQDLGEGVGKLLCTVEVVNGTIWINPKGYGDNTSTDGSGSPIGIELYNGRLRVLAWNDINSCDPVIVDMEGARESKRKTGKIE